MAAPQHQAGRGLSHSGNQLRDAQTGLDVPAYGVQQKQDAKSKPCTHAGFCRREYMLSAKRHLQFVVLCNIYFSNTAGA